MFLRGKYLGSHVDQFAGHSPLQRKLCTATELHSKQVGIDILGDGKVKGSRG